MQVFLDLDGVLVDFIGGCCRLFGKELQPYPLGEWNFFHTWGLSEAEFYGEIRRAGSQFWADLDWTLDGEAILHCVEQYARQLGAEPVMFISSPTRAADSWAGKVDWVKRHIPGGGSRLILTHAKASVSGPGKLLIDDKPSNVRAWVNRYPRHASGVLLPRPWNEFHPLAERALPYLARELARCVAEQNAR